MNKILPTAISYLLFAVAALVFPVAHAFAAPSVLFDKTSVSVSQNSTFTVNIAINVDANSAQSSKVTVQYAPADLDVVQVTDGHFFPQFAQNNLDGVLEIIGYNSAPGAGSTANGTLATITFKAKKGSGSSTMSMLCTGSGHDSNIVTVASQNILDCTQTNQVGVAYLGAAVPTNTPTPTPAPGTTPTPTPTPSNQNTVPVCAGLNADITNAVGTPLAVTFTCAGVDTDGYINAAYFDFGDRTNDTIEKNVGSPGSVTTTHTYTTIGSLGASCKVRDNNNVWSSVPGICNKIVYIQPKPQVIRTYANATNTTKTVTAATPTPAVVTLIEVTPTATPSARLTPLPTEAVTGQSSSAFNWLLGSVITIIIGAVIYLLSRRGHKHPDDIPPMVQPPVNPPTIPPPMQ